MIISIIAAIAKNGVIGKDNKLIWHLPADLKHFRALTLGKPIIMGRKTYASIGRPLPDRRNIVISRQPAPNCSSCEYYPSLNEALTAVAAAPEIMIIGGAEIYKLALPYTHKMYLTYIHHYFEGDTHFPKWEKEQWEEIERTEFAPDKENPYTYSFVTLQRSAKGNTK